MRTSDGSTGTRASASHRGVGRRANCWPNWCRAGTDISSSDQGNSFQAFYDFLLSESRQDELAELLGRVQLIARTEADTRLRTIHHDWSEAAERTQQTVRLI